MPEFGCPNRYTGLPNGLDMSLMNDNVKDQLKGQQDNYNSGVKMWKTQLAFCGGLIIIIFILL